MLVYTMYICEIYRKKKSSYQVKQILSVLCKLVTLILDLNNVKGLRVTKIVKQIKFEEAWGELVAKCCSRRQS